MRYRFTISIFCLLLLACNKEQIKPGQSYTVQDMTVDFVDFSDNRCPEGVECIVAGEGIAYLKGNVDQDSEDFDLKIGEIDTVLGYSVRLDDLTPFPTGESIPASQKKAHLTINKL